MKHIVFFWVIITVILSSSVDLLGQELAKKKGTNGKWGFVDITGNEVIPMIYEKVRKFSEGFAAVKANDKWGFIDKTGKVLIPFQYTDAYNFYEDFANVSRNGTWLYIDKAGIEYYTLTREEAQSAQRTQRERAIKLAAEKKKKEQEATFSNFAKPYVEQRINEWQKKDEFENRAEFDQRVNETTRKQKAKELAKEAEEIFIAEQTKDLYMRLTLGTYDAENQTFPITSNLSPKTMLVHVPKNEARYFKETWEQTKYTPQYRIENEKIELSAIDFKTTSGISYQYNEEASLNYSETNIEYNFSPIDFDYSDKPPAQKGNQTISTKKISVGLSDVAANIPQTNTINDKTFVVIIANENYRKEAQVIYAKNDGEIFKQYCIKTLGIPEINIHFIADATLNDIRSEISWISKVAYAYKDEAKLIFYYAGHGVPEEKTKNSYILPIDGYGSDIVKTGYSLDELYAELGNLPAKHITIFMDACFSGAQRSGEMLASARYVAIKAQPGEPVGNMVVFSAAQGDETAHPYEEKGHGIFTYFLLKKLQETKGEATLEELEKYITTNVKQQSIVVNKKSQTPTVTPSATLENWQTLKLK
jgi:hypothetical protein